MFQSPTKGQRQQQQSSSQYQPQPSFNVGNSNGAPPPAAAAASKKKRRDITSIKQFKQHVYQHGIPQLYALIEQNPLLMYPPDGIQEAREHNRLSELLRDCEALPRQPQHGGDIAVAAGGAADALLPKGSVRGALYPTDPYFEALADIKDFLASIDEEGSKSNNNNNNIVSVVPEDISAIEQQQPQEVAEQTAEITKPQSEVEKLESQLRDRLHDLQERRQNQRRNNNSNSHSLSSLTDDQLANYHHVQLNALVRLFYEFNHNEFVKVPAQQTLALLRRCGRESIAHLTEFEYHARQEKRRKRETRQEAFNARKRARETESGPAAGGEELQRELDDAERKMSQIVGNFDPSGSGFVEEQQHPTDMEDMIIRGNHNGHHHDEEGEHEEEYEMLRAREPQKDDDIVADPFAAMYGEGFGEP